MNDWDEYLDDDYYNENILGNDGCCLGKDCCMPGEHDESECFTKEMAEDYEAQFKIPESVDYLISRGFTAKDYQNAINEKRRESSKTIGRHHRSVKRTL